MTTGFDSPVSFFSFTPSIGVGSGLFSLNFGGGVYVDLVTHRLNQVRLWAIAVAPSLIYVAAMLSLEWVVFGVMLCGVALLVSVGDVSERWSLDSHFPFPPVAILVAPLFPSFARRFFADGSPWSRRLVVLYCTVLYVGLAKFVVDFTADVIRGHP